MQTTHIILQCLSLHECLSWKWKFTIIPRSYLHNEYCYQNNKYFYMGFLEAQTELTPTMSVGWWLLSFEFVHYLTLDSALIQTLTITNFWQCSNHYLIGTDYFWAVLTIILICTFIYFRYGYIIIYNKNFTPKIYYKSFYCIRNHLE